MKKHAKNLLPLLINNQKKEYLDFRTFDLNQKKRKFYFLNFACKCMIAHVKLFKWWLQKLERVYALLLCMIICILEEDDDEKEKHPIINSIY